MPLKWLNSIESPSGRIARWALELQQYNFEMAYRKGQIKTAPTGDATGLNGDNGAQ